jgi:hypothetical protein
MILSGFVESWTEAQVRQVLGRPRLGVTLSEARRCLVQAGAIALLYDDWSLDDLRDSLAQGQYPIVGIERHPLGYPPASHAVVLVSLTSRHVKVLDPLDGPQAKQYGLRAFLLAWKLSGREALVITAPPRPPTE